MQGKLQMEQAKCFEDGIIYTAVSFSRLHSDDLARKRRSLYCTECSGPAFFRHASFNGRAACFGARPHADACSLAAQDNERLEECAGDDLDALHIPSGKIIVDFSYGTPELPVHDAGSDHASIIDRTARNSDRTDAQAHRRLSSLLRMLIGLPAFRTSDKTIEINGLGQIAARDFFVPLEFTGRQYSDLFRGYWGLITDAQRTDDGSIWLNSGGRKSISFCIDSKFVDLMNKRYRLESLEDLAGAYILAFGISYVSANGKLHVIIQGPEYISLRLIKG
jgi:hypothetical protein